MLEKTNYSKQISLPNELSLTMYNQLETKLR